MVGHTNDHEHTDEPMGEPEDTSCQLGISIHCTEQGAQTWQETPCCAPCAALAMESAYRALARDLSAADDLWARR